MRHPRLLPSQNTNGNCAQAAAVPRIFLNNSILPAHKPFTVQVSPNSRAPHNQKHIHTKCHPHFCSILSWWNIPSPAPIVGKRFRWFLTCRFEAKPTSKTAKCVATRSKSVTAYRIMHSRNSPPKPSNKFVVECNRLVETTCRTGGSQAKGRFPRS